MSSAQLLKGGTRIKSGYDERVGKSARVTHWNALFQRTRTGQPVAGAAENDDNL
jgi:hypothetical protein